MSDETNNRPTSTTRRPERHERCFYCGRRVGWPMSEPATVAFVGRSSAFIGVVACDEHKEMGADFAESLTSNLMCLSEVVRADGGQFQDDEDGWTRDECRRLLPELDVLEMTEDERELFRRVAAGNGRLWPDERKQTDAVLERLFPTKIAGIDDDEESGDSFDDDTDTQGWNDDAADDGVEPDCETDK